VLVNVSSNVPAALSKSVHPGAKAALAEICNAEDMAHALVAVNAFEADCGAKWPKAVVKITEHVDVLLAFYDYPAEHWLHLRTTNPIESTFATVRLRQRVTKDPARGPPESTMAFELIEFAQAAGVPSTPPPGGAGPRRRQVRKRRAHRTTRLGRVSLM
jgi:hypothetical protein